MQVTPMGGGGGFRLLNKQDRIKTGKDEVRG